MSITIFHTEDSGTETWLQVNDDGTAVVVRACAGERGRQEHTRHDGAHGRPPTLTAANAAPAARDACHHCGRVRAGRKNRKAMLSGDGRNDTAELAQFAARVGHVHMRR